MSCNQAIGFYGTYSEGYVPPQITDVFGKTTNNAYLLPQTFKNYELGGWLSLLENKLYIDYSFYLMNGTNETINVRLPDNTTASQNAGATRHKGIEYGISYRPVEDLYPAIKTQGIPVIPIDSTKIKLSLKQV